MQSEQSQRELLTFFKSLQKQDSQELISMKSYLHEKFTEDLLSLSKEREKSKTLFLEVVRLGEQQEKSNEKIQNLNLLLDGKLKNLENRLHVGEKNLNQISVKGEQGIDNFSDWNEKLEKRVQGLEGNLLSLGVKKKNFFKNKRV